MKKNSIFVFLFVALIAVKKANGGYLVEDNDEACEVLEGLGDDGTCTTFNLQSFPFGTGTHTDQGQVKDGLAGILLAIDCLASAELDIDGETIIFDDDICDKIPYDDIALAGECCPFYPAIEVIYDLLGEDNKDAADQIAYSIDLLCTSIQCLENNGLTIPNVNPDEDGICYDEDDECPISDDFLDEVWKHFEIYLCGLHTCGEKLYRGLLKGIPGLVAGLPLPTSGLQLDGVLKLVLGLVGTLLQLVLGLLSGGLGGILTGVTGSLDLSSILGGVTSSLDLGKLLGGVDLEGILGGVTGSLDLGKILGGLDLEGTLGGVTGSLGLLSVLSSLLGGLPVGDLPIGSLTGVVGGVSGR